MSPPAIAFRKGGWRAGWAARRTGREGIVTDSLASLKLLMGWFQAELIRWETRLLGSAQTMGQP
ncbi:TPA: hypothetical protein DIV55_00535 [Patescibacteria group bacterium]|uniref:Uncharacterized protein n=1 Tax=Candidatus Gottesmanbacteria bacterium GW2011_GWA1_43_11 TaxID=1618436 RepID=A0A0G1F9R9_9BACT|nr:MAG: hypothetical protein UV59_C0036G0013 [Candidatus Gottesmanbacteria bacterium GW2011_GWA1_43_11]HCS78211.1 hypothetical protein [Patescibacteria group bacterium]